jgi:methyl-accepting chemotaxis protein
MAKFGIKAKIWMMIAMFCAGYVALMLLLQWTNSVTQKHMAIASGSLFPAALSSQDASAGFQKMAKRYNDAILLQDKKTLASADEDAEVVTAALRSVQAKTDLSPERQKQASSLIDRLADIHARSKSVYTAMIENPDSVTDQTQRDISALARDNKQMGISLAELRNGLAQDFQGELDTVTRWSSKQRTLGFLVLLLALLCGGGLSAVVIERQIALPLRQLTSRLQDIAEGEGDVTKRLEVVSADELGEISRFFNLFMDKLQNVMRHVESNTRRVREASRQLLEDSRQITTNSGETSAQANAVAQATEQVNQNLQTVTHGAEGMTSTIQHIASNARQATKVALQAVQAAEAANCTMAKLGASSVEIGAVVKVITSIAQQTNLLALNATIEAAGAGDAGKGFAVVAHEVKELARQTAKATDDIGHKISAIQTDTKSAVAVIATISEVINQISGISGTIASAVEEQSATTDEMTRNVSAAAQGAGNISANIGGVARAADNTSARAQDSEKSAQKLVEIAGELNDLVFQFKVERRDPRVKLAVPAVLITNAGKEQDVMTIDISHRGACLHCADGTVSVGDLVSLARLHKKEQFRVMWVGEADASTLGQLGVAPVNPNSSFWDDLLEGTPNAEFDATSTTDDRHLWDEETETVSR